MVGAEFKVVPDQIEARLGTHKEISFYVKARGAAKISHEVIAADVIHATQARTGRHIEVNALQAYAPKGFGGDMLTHWYRIDSIEVIKERTVRLISTPQAPADAPSCFRVDPEVLFKNKAAPEVQVCPAAQRLGRIITRGTGCGRCYGRAPAEIHVHPFAFLGQCGLWQQKNQTYNREQS